MTPEAVIVLIALAVTGLTGLLGLVATWASRARLAREADALDRQAEVILDAGRRAPAGGCAHSRREPVTLLDGTHIHDLCLDCDGTVPPTETDPFTVALTEAMTAPVPQDDDEIVVFCAGPVRRGPMP